MNSYNTGGRPVRVRARTRRTRGWDTLAAMLTGRDRWILRMLAEHRVLTTTHLTALAFPSVRAAQLRLRSLNEVGVIAGFRPLTTRGSSPTHWVLDTTGAAVLAAEDGIDPPTGLDNRRAQRLAIAHSNQLAHLLGVNTAITTLTATTETSAAGSTTLEEQDAASGRLVVWWSAARCATVTSDHIRPDGYARWKPTPSVLQRPKATGDEGAHSQRERGSGLGFWFEYDTGSERLAQLAGKLVGYHDLAAVTATVIPILFWLPSPTREANARAALAEVTSALTHPHIVPIATGNPLAHTASPARSGRPGVRCPPSLAARVWAALPAAYPTPSDTTIHRPGRAHIGELCRSWPNLTDPHTAETTVLAARQPVFGRRPGANGYRGGSRHPGLAWSTQLTPPTPAPPSDAGERHS